MGRYSWLEDLVSQDVDLRGQIRLPFLTLTWTLE